VPHFAVKRVHYASLVARRLPTLALVVLAIGCGGDDEERASPPPSRATESTAQTGEASELARTEGPPRLETVATGLEIPWDLAFLPDGRALVTERPGRVRLLTSELELREGPVADFEEVAHIGEGGLLGVAVDPRFERNSFVYLYRTTSTGNEVLRYRFRDGRLADERVVLDGIQAGAIHDGGRIRFGPDGLLYVATGDAGVDELAQDRNSLNGKVLRLRDGQVELFTLGHRNPQGLDWQPGTNRLISDEHGPDGDDEVNVLEPGRNYGWPSVRGTDHDGFTAPVAVYADSIAPSGATFVSLPGSEWTGDYLIGALVGEQIRRLSFEGTRVTENEALFEGELGRVRVVVEGPDGALYALTSNRDGRGDAREGDDRIVRIVPPAG
jgi:glucose/arabinose dehydrogenase